MVRRRGRPLPLPLFFSDLIFLSFLLGSIQFRVGDGVRIEIRVRVSVLFIFPKRFLHGLGLGLSSLEAGIPFLLLFFTRFGLGFGDPLLLLDPNGSNLFLTPDIIYI